ncbi:MAG: GNAT family N-acetyltransferase [Lachnospiraceae bacterium]|jgi:RimJ/RimL family protein N-acetyltransferase|nr:GNAT family N-acetyltransferase [Lachnospiraceae bacterium]
MIFTEKEILLRDGTKCILRSPNEHDAEQMLSYFLTVSEESYFMINYPEEILFTEEEEKELLIKKAESATDIMIAAVINNKIIGNSSLYCYCDKKKMRHRSCIGVAIEKEYQGKGLGDLLVRETILMAKQIGFSQIELGVFSDNEKALNLYKKYGFERWGCTRQAFLLKDGTFRDEIVMGLMI